MKRKVVKGATVSLVGQATNQLLRFVSNLILSRLLFPEAFGLMGLVLTLQMGLEMLSDIGIRTSIIQHKRGEEPRFRHTAWTLQLLRGVVLWGAGAAMAIPAALIYDDKPELRTLIPVATMVSLIFGAYSSKYSLLYRNMQLGRVVAIELTGQVVALIVKVAHALVFGSVWSLVVGYMVDIGLRMVLSHLVLPGGRDRLAWEPKAVKELLSFGKWVFVSTTITFFALRFDMIALGKLVSATQLGVYQISLSLSSVPIAITGQVIGSVVLPAFSEASRQNHETLTLRFAQARQLAAPLGLFIILAVALFAPTFFHFLYDDRYTEAGWMAQLSMIAVYFNYQELLSTRALLAIGDAKPLAQTNALKLVTTVALSLLGFRYSGIPGFLLGIGAGAAMGYIFAMSALWRRHQLPAGLSDAGFITLGLLLGGLGTLGPTWLGARWGLDAEARVLLSVALAMVILSPMALWASMAVLRKAFKEELTADELVERFFGLRKLSLPLGAVGILGASLLAPPLVRLLRGELRADTALTIQMALLVVWLLYLELITARAPVRALDRKGLQRVSALKTIASLGATTLGYHLGGLQGLIIGVGAAAALSYILMTALSKTAPFDLLPCLVVIGVATVGTLAPSWLLSVYPFEVSIPLKRRTIDQHVIAAVITSLGLLLPVALYGVVSLRAAFKARSAPGE